MMRNLAATTLAAVLLTAPACELPAGDSPAAPESPRVVVELGPAANCAVPVASYLRRIDQGRPDAVPTWSQLDCYLGDLARAVTHRVIATAPHAPGAIADLDDAGTPGRAWRAVEAQTAWDAAWPSNNFSVANLGDMPPYAAPDGGPLDLRDPEVWDRKLRAMAAYGSYVKGQGRCLRASYFMPAEVFEPAGRWRIGAEGVTSPATLLAWFDAFFVPQRSSLARVAELVQAEELMPWDEEPTRMVRALGGDWFEAMPAAEQVALVQALLDRLEDALRPVFSGTLSLTLDAREDGDRGAWAALDVSGWDQVNVAFVADGDVAGSAAALDAQLAFAMAVLDGSPRVPWVAQEVTFRAPGAAPEAEAGLYRALFDKLAAQPRKPVGIGLTAGTIETAEAAALVRARVAAVSQHGF